LRSKLFLAVVVSSICGALAVAGFAVAAHRAETKVTINTENGDFFGKVKSPRLHRCADNRTVKVFKQRGRHQHPRTDTKIASDTSELHGDHGEWSTGNTGVSSGKYYARAGRTPRCKADSSRTVRVQR
jgi:hypothetical protein